MGNNWIRYEPNRTKSEVFICPYCKGRVYFKHNKSGQCGYKFCPHCGKVIIKNES